MLFHNYPVTKHFFKGPVGEHTHVSVCVCDVEELADVIELQITRRHQEACCSSVACIRTLENEVRPEPHRKCQSNASIL